MLILNKNSSILSIVDQKKSLDSTSASILVFISTYIWLILLVDKRKLEGNYWCAVYIYFGLLLKVHASRTSLFR